MVHESVNTVQLPEFGSHVKITKIGRLHDEESFNEVGDIAFGILNAEIEIGKPVLFLAHTAGNKHKQCYTTEIDRINFVKEGVVDVYTKNSIWRIALDDGLPKSGNVVNITKISQLTNEVRGGGQLGTSGKGFTLMADVKIGCAVEALKDDVRFLSSKIKKVNLVKKGLTNVETDNSVWQIEVLS